MFFRVFVSHFCCCMGAIDFCAGSIAFLQALVEYFCCCSAFGFHPATPHFWGGYSGPWIALCFGHRCCLLFLVLPVVYSFHSGEVSGFNPYLGTLKFGVYPIDVWGEG